MSSIYPARSAYPARSGPPGLAFARSYACGTCPQAEPCPAASVIDLGPGFPKRRRGCKLFGV